MGSIRLVPVGGTDDALLVRLGRALSGDLGVDCVVGDHRIDPAPAFHPERRQYHSSTIISQLGALQAREAWLLGVTPVDLFIPILTFVFGEAETGGRCATVSTHRLRQEFYGLPPDGDLFFDRLMKEAAHEIGHLWSLHHCDEYACVMAPSHSVEWVDLKTSRFCDRCRARQSRVEPEQAVR